MAACVLVLVLGGAAWAAEEASQAPAEGHGEAAHGEPAQGEAAHGEDSHGGGHGGGWANTDTFRVINFIVLAGGLFLILRKPAAAALAGRIEDIRRQLEDLEAKKLAAEKELVAYTERLATLKDEADKIVREQKALGERAREKILAEAERSAEKLKEQAKRHLEHEIKAARESLRADILAEAIAMGEDLIRKNITDEDQNRLANEFLEKAVAQ
jgi:F-type H+-transporting ATPase subunit b